MPAQIADRREEIAAALRASGAAWQYQDRQPERDHFRLWHRWRDERTAIGLVAYHSTMAMHRRYDALYGAHGPTCWWCYEPPPGVDVLTEQPDDWQGWCP
jgi:accessory colonization factor AcfC